jgi:CubicO group peptidase (beta-lactamase class C family)
MRLPSEHKAESTKLSTMKILLFCLLLPLVAIGQRNYPALLDSFMQAEAAVHHFNGNVLVAKDGNILYQKAFGYGNYHTKQRLNNNSVFELQSITKQFTAMAILMLMEKGKLSLSDSLRKFFPQLPYRSVTLRHMLTHTSGLPDDIDVLAKYWDHKKVASNKDLIQILAYNKVPPHFSPGQKVEYSNTAFQLLSSIIEKVSGLTYAAFLQQHIFNPLDMRSSHIYTTTHSSKQNLPNFAYGYIYSDSLKRYILPASLPELEFVVYSDGMSGAGNISSTTGDLFKWDRALKNHKLVSQATQDQMFHAQSVADSASQMYWGYGAHKLGTNELGPYIIGGGSYPGYEHIMVAYPEDDIVIILLSNNETNPRLLSGALAYIVTDRAVVNAYVHTEKRINSSLLEGYVGKYNIPNVANPMKMDLFKEQGKLFVQFENATERTELKAESDTKFFNGNGLDQQIEFELDASSKVFKAFVIFGGMKKQMEKVK